MRFFPDLLKKPPSSRIIFTTAAYAFLHNLTVDNLNYPSGHPNTLQGNTKPYSNSNLANIIIADNFAKKLQGTGVTSNSYHPGAVYNSNHFKSAFALLQINPYVSGFINYFLEFVGKVIIFGNLVFVVKLFSVRIAGKVLKLPFT